MIMASASLPARLTMVAIVAVVVIMCSLLLASITLSIDSKQAARAFRGVLRSDHDDEHGTNPNNRQLYADGNPSPPLLVGVYYYPWHTNSFHNGHGFIRDQLEPPQMPYLGKYVDIKEAVIKQHLKWCMDSNINLWMMSWWGRGARETNTAEVMLDYMLREREAYDKSPQDPTDFPIKDFRVAMFYETKKLIREKEEKPGYFDISGVEEDIKYMADNYFHHPNYLYIDDKPVINVYLTRRLYSDDKTSHPFLLAQVILLMRRGASAGGYNDIYIIGDHALASPASIPPETYSPFVMLDAVTNYDVFGSMHRPLYAGDVDEEIDGKTRVQYYDEIQRGWKERAAQQGCGFIPSVTPGFNNQHDYNPDRKYGPMSRKLTQHDDEGSLLEALLANAIQIVDPNANNMLLITSFNEFQEDTMIEPIITLDGANGSVTTEPAIVTTGLEYEAYGTLYLDIVREYTQGLS